MGGIKRSAQWGDRWYEGFRLIRILALYSEPPCCRYIVHLVAHKQPAIPTGYAVRGVWYISPKFYARGVTQKCIHNFNQEA